MKNNVNETEPKKICNCIKGKKCSECKKEYMKKWREENKEHIKKYNKQVSHLHYSKYKDSVKKAIKKYYQNNKEKISITRNKWEEENEERSYQNRLNWRKNNKHKINKRAVDRRKENQLYRIKENIGSRIRSSFKKKRINKNNSSLKYLGCDIEFYKKYLESQFKPEMNWKNYGTYWEIDHIEQLFKFDLSKEEEQLKAFNYKNTRPLEKITNRKRPKK